MSWYRRNTDTADAATTTVWRERAALGPPAPTRSGAAGAVKGQIIRAGRKSPHHPGDAALREFGAREMRLFLYP